MAHIECWDWSIDKNVYDKCGEREKESFEQCDQRKKYEIKKDFRQHFLFHSRSQISTTEFGFVSVRYIFQKCKTLKVRTLLLDEFMHWMRILFGGGRGNGGKRLLLSRFHRFISKFYDGFRGLFCFLFKYCKIFSWICRFVYLLTVNFFSPVSNIFTHLHHFQ